jgi:hypothetical protein
MNFGTYGFPQGLGINSGLFSLPSYKNMWTPAYIPTQLWLDSSDISTITTISGALSQWNDKSGSSNNFTQSTSSQRPLYSSSVLNSLAGILFDGVDDYLQSTVINTQTTNTSVFIVSSPFSLNVKGHTFKNGNSTGYAVGYGSTTSDSLGNNFIYIRETIQWHPSVSYGGISPNIVSSIINMTTIDNYLNGNIIQTISGIPSAPSTGTYIGGFRAFNGYVFEIIFCPLSVTPTNRQKIEGYLAHKWGLVGNLSSTHPYKFVPPYL